MKQEYIHVIEKYLDGELSESQLDGFHRLVDENDEFKSELQEALEFKGLTYCSQHSQYQNLEDAVLAELSQSSLDLEDKVLSELAQESKRPKAFPAWLISAIAAQVILLPVLYFLMKAAPVKDTEVKIVELKVVPVARVTEIEGFNFVIRGELKINVINNDILYSGDQLYISRGGQLRLKYEDGSKLHLIDESYVRLTDTNGQKKIELFSGTVKADVEKQPAGKQMEILTEHSKCDVLGTSFTLVSSDVSSLLDVFEGKVSFKFEDESLEVPAGYFASAGGDAKFEVKKSHHPLYMSPLVTKETPGHQVPINVDIRGARKLFLVVSNGGLNNRFDHSAWIRPRLTGPKGTLDLTELKWKIAKSGYHTVKKNKGYHGRELLVEGVDLKIGIAAHATSIIAWDIPEGYDTFEATGVLLDSGTLQEGSVPSVNFEVHTSMPEKKLKKLMIKKSHY